MAPPQQNLGGLITGESPQPRRLFGTAREGFDALGDKLGLPRPNTPLERVSGDVGSALVGGGGIMGAGRSLATRAPGVGQFVGEILASRPGTQLASLVAGAGAGGTTREAGGGPLTQWIASLAGGLSPAAAEYAGASGLRGLLRGGEAGRQSMEGRISDFRAVGANPSVGQATGNRRTQGLEGMLSGAPTSGGRLAGFAEKQASDIGSGLQRKAEQFFPNASAERAGTAVNNGAETFAGNVKATRKALYWQADKLIPGNTSLPLSNTRRTLAELVTPTRGAEATTGGIISPQIKAIADNVAADLEANGGVMPYEAIKKLRSLIGPKSAATLVPDPDAAAYKRLYGALSKDMEEAARQQGGDAWQAMKRANTYTKASADRLEQVQRVVDKNGGPEKVYNAVMSGTQDGGTTLRAVMQSLPKEGQRAMTAAVIKRMGLATAGAQGAAGETFSAQTMLRKWNNVSDEAKRALFDRHGPAFSKDMDRIAQGGREHPRRGEGLRQSVRNR